VGTRYLVTGGLGFIGSAFVRSVALEGAGIINVDLETYAGDWRRIERVRDAVDHRKLDIADPEIEALVQEVKPEVIVHFAAESHVTRSETAEEIFFRTNVHGTRRLLEAAEKVGVGLFVHVSTDEVYGPCFGRPFREADKAEGEGNATSVYARSKALADDLARSFMGRVPTIVVRPANCFGPWQHPEKAIPRWIARALDGDRLPVWGDGRQVRDWLFVDDACDAIRLIAAKGAPGEVYNVAPQRRERTNREVAEAVALAAGAKEDAVYLTAYDRPRHDRRYAIDASRIRSLGWRPRRSFEEAVRQTVDWYSRHRSWWWSHIGEAELLYDDSLERA
jgi:dTDP-glucose 4,6-dehydratase